MGPVPGTPPPARARLEAVVSDLKARLPESEPTPATSEDVVLLEDLAPRNEPRGGARKLVFGEEDPAARRPRTGE